MFSMAIVSVLIPLHGVFSIVYAECCPNFSMVISGDADGKLTAWDWKTTRIFNRFKAHDGVCIGCLWLPHETSKVITCGWDGTIKIWD